MLVFHVAGKLNAVDAPMVGGGTVVLLTRYEIESVVEAIDTHRPTTGWITTPMARGILASPASDEYDMTSLETMPPGDSASRVATADQPRAAATAGSIGPVSTARIRASGPIVRPMPE